MAVVGTQIENSQEECEAIFFSGPSRFEPLWFRFLEVYFEQCDVTNCDCVTEEPIMSQRTTSCCLTTETVSTEPSITRDGRSILKAERNTHCPSGFCTPILDENGEQISFFSQAKSCPLADIHSNYDELIDAGYKEIWGFACRVREASVCGEPHIQLWNGTWFDYHGGCSLVYMKAPSYAGGLGLEIHIRTKVRYEYSFIESAAIKIGDDDILEVASWGQYWLNGVESATLPATIGDRTITYKQVDAKEHHFVIPTYGIGGDHREHILVSTFKDFVSVYIKNGMQANFGDSVGLMGQFGNGAMLGRNGELLDHDPNVFGQSWQVLDTEPMLFQSLIGPQYPSKCVLPDATAAKGRPRRLGESLAHEAAEEACAHLPTDQEQKNCVFDVMATGDIEMARPRAI